MFCKNEVYKNMKKLKKYFGGFGNVKYEKILNFE